MMPTPSSPTLARPSFSMDNARQQIERLVQERLIGRKIDGVGFIDALLAHAAQVGEVHCSHFGEKTLRFQLPGTDSFDVELDANRGKLRMLCARLAVLVGETDGKMPPLYGGEGHITRALSVQNGQAGSFVERRFYLRHQNSNAAPIEFTITAL
jgi:hypothetical protein